MLKHLFLNICLLFSILTFSQENLHYKEGIYSVEIELANKSHLILNQENTFQIVTKNIETVNLSAAGKNLKIKKGAENNRSVWIVTPSNEMLADGFYQLNITFRGRKGKLFSHQFLIPVKE